MLDSETDLADGLERFFPVVLDKTVYQNADAIARQLDAIGVGEVNLFGIDTDICVLQNAARLFDLGYRVNVLYDLCATNAGFAIHSAMLTVLQRTVGRKQVKRFNPATRGMP